LVAVRAIPNILILAVLIGSLVLFLNFTEPALVGTWHLLAFLAK
jgi:hypothetical protein